MLKIATVDGQSISAWHIFLAVTQDDVPVPHVRVALDLRHGSNAEVGSCPT